MFLRKYLYTLSLILSGCMPTSLFEYHTFEPIDNEDMFVGFSPNISESNVVVYGNPYDVFFRIKMKKNEKLIYSFKIENSSKEVVFHRENESFKFLGNESSKVEVFSEDVELSYRDHALFIKYEIISPNGYLLENKNVKKNIKYSFRKEKRINM